MLSDYEIKAIEEKNNKVEELVKKYIYEDDFNSKSEMQSFVLRLRNTLCRNRCETLRELYLHKEDLRGATKGSKSFMIIERMRKDYENVEFKRKRLEEIDKEIRKLSEERKAIMRELES